MLVEDSTRLVGAVYELISPRDRRATLAANGNAPTAPSSSTPPPHAAVIELSEFQAVLRTLDGHF